MADTATRRQLRINAALRLWGPAVVGAVAGFGFQAWMGWDATGFLMSYFANALALAGWTPSPKTADWLIASIGGFVLGLGAAKSPPGQSMLKRLMPDPPPFAKSGLETLRWRTTIKIEQAPVALFGRENDMNSLMGLIQGADRPALWRIVTGPPGIGKTRLMLEWLMEARAKGWDAGVVDPETAIADDWRPRRPTALVFDEVERDWGDRLWPALVKVMAAGRAGAPVRVVVGDKLIPHVEDVADGGERDQLRKTFREILSLGELHRADAEKMWQAAGGIGPLNDLGGFRPRILLLLAHARAGASLAEALADWAARLVPDETDSPVLEKLALAGLAGPVPVEYEARRLLPYFHASDLTGTVLPALEPEELGREILLRALTKLCPSAWESVMALGLAGNAGRVEANLANLWRERAEAAEALAAWNTPEPPAGPAGLLIRLQRRFDEICPERVQASHEKIALWALETETPDSLAALTAILSRIAHAADGRPFDRQIRFWDAAAAVIGMNHYGEVKDFDALEAWGERLTAIAEAFPDDRDIRLSEAMGAVNTINHYGTAQRFDDLEQWGNRLIAIAEAFPGDRDIRLSVAKGAVNAINHYGSAQRFDDLEQWGNRLIAIAEAFPDDRDIRLEEAKGAVNAISDYGRARRFDDLGRWGDRLIAAAKAFPDDRDIRLTEAMGAGNAISHYGTAQRFGDLERWGERLIAIAAAFPDDRDIRLSEAKGAVNAIGHYGGVQRFDDLEHWGERLIAIAKVFPDNRDIRLGEAQGAVNAIDGYGTARRFGDLEHWGERLIAVAAAFPDDRDIRLTEAKGAVNALVDYSEVGATHQAAIRTWRSRLAGCARAFPGDMEIQQRASRFDLGFAQQDLTRPMIRQ